MREI
jgi:hypothetical protein